MQLACILRKCIYRYMNIKIMKNKYFIVNNLNNYKYFNKYTKIAVIIDNKSEHYYYK